MKASCNKKVPRKRKYKKVLILMRNIIKYVEIIQGMYWVQEIMNYRKSRKMKLIQQKFFKENGKDLTMKRK